LCRCGDLLRHPTTNQLQGWRRRCRRHAGPV